MTTYANMHPVIRFLHFGKLILIATIASLAQYMQLHGTSCRASRNFSCPVSVGMQANAMNMSMPCTGRQPLNNSIRTSDKCEPEVVNTLDPVFECREACCWNLFHLADLITYRMHSNLGYDLHIVGYLYSHTTRATLHDKSRAAAELWERVAKARQSALVLPGFGKGMLCRTPGQSV